MDSNGFINYSTARIIDVPKVPYSMSAAIAATSDTKKRKDPVEEMLEVKNDRADDDDDEFEDDDDFEGKKKRAPAKKPSEAPKVPKKPRKVKDGIEDEFSTMSLPQLKARAKELGLKLGGNKPDLIARNELV
jgi:hypothetical protein